MLDVALFIAALASVASALPGLLHGGDLLLSVIGELMLCVIASGLAIYGRGYLVQAKNCRAPVAAPSRPSSRQRADSLYFCSRKPSTASV